MKHTRTTAAAAGALLTLMLALTPATPARANMTGIAYPGMTIIQGNTKCTLAYIDTIHRKGYSAGHCHTASTVTDEDHHPHRIRN
jgi:hypothetical protein